MKKILFQLLLIIISYTCFGQVSVSSIHENKAIKFKKGSLEAFKNTKTIFVLSNIYNKEVYEAILKDTWTVTPYEIVSEKNFDPIKYIDGKNSFARLSGHTLHSDGGATYLFTYVDIFLFDMEDKQKELGKYKAKNSQKKADYDLMEENRLPLARFYLFGSDEFIGDLYTKPRNNVAESMHNDDVFYNYKPGFLKNYFQKVNAQLTKGEIYDLYENEVKPEIAKLRTATLYVPLMRMN